VLLALLHCVLSRRSSASRRLLHVEGRSAGRFSLSFLSFFPLHKSKECVLVVSLSSPTSVLTSTSPRRRFPPPLPDFSSLTSLSSHKQQNGTHAPPPRRAVSQDTLQCVPFLSHFLPTPHSLELMRASRADRPHSVASRSARPPSRQEHEEARSGSGELGR
jgi:hypothetical protein